jgi:hypothetical protein
MHDQLRFVFRHAAILNFCADPVSQASSLLANLDGGQLRGRIVRLDERCERKEMHQASAA